MAAIAADLRPRVSRMTSDMLAIGQALLRAKQLLPHGQFIDWVEREVGVDRRTASWMLGGAQRFEGKWDTVSHLPTTVLYELASPSTPDTVVKQVLAGELEPSATIIRQSRGVANRKDQSDERIAVRALRALEDLCNTTQDPPGTLANAILTYGDPDNVVVALVNLIEEAVELLEAAVGVGLLSRVRLSWTPISHMSLRR